MTQSPNPIHQPEALLPCPFCGESGARVDADLDAPQPALLVHCHCGAEGSTRNTAELSIEAWNRRATPTPAERDAVPAETGEVARLANECRTYIDDLAQWKEDDSEALHEAAWESALQTLNRLASLAQPQVAASPALAPEASFEEWYLEHTGNQPTLASARYYALTKDAKLAKAAWHAALAASPLAPTVAERVPLTMSQLNGEARKSYSASSTVAGVSFDAFIAGVRFAEAHHGIGAEKTGEKG